MKIVLEFLMGCFGAVVLLACVLVVLIFIGLVFQTIYKIYIRKNTLNDDFYNGKLN